MTTIATDFAPAPPLTFAPRPTPRKLGEPPRRNAASRDEYHRQLDFLVAQGGLSVKDRDFLQAVTYAYSDRTAKDFYPSQSTMAELRRCSRRTIQRRVAGAKAAGVLLVAQLKGFDRSTATWYCSSNTHRPSFVPEWVEKARVARKERRDAQREKRLSARAQRPGRRSPGPEESRPAVPDFDPDESARVRREALSPEEARAKAREARAILLRPKPPHQGA
jgi:hypothetical protein